MSPVDWWQNRSSWNGPYLNQCSPTPLHPSPHSLPMLTQTLVFSTAPADYDYSAVGKPVPSDRVTLGVCMFVVVGVTFMSNLFVLVSFIVEKKLRTTFSALIAHLACVDMFVAVMAMNFYTIDIMYGYWPFGKVLCGIWVVFDHNLVTASCYTLAAIAIDRMWSITWSINYRQHIGMKKAAGFIIVIWCLMVLIIMYPVISDRVLRTHLYHCEFVPSQNPQFAIVLAVLAHHTPCCIIVGCSIVVSVRIKKLARTRPAAVQHSAVGGANQANRAGSSRIVTLNQTELWLRVEQAKGGARGGTGWRWGWLKRGGGSAAVAKKVGTTVTEKHDNTEAAGEKGYTKMAAAAMPSSSTSTLPETNGTTLDVSSATHSRNQISAGTTTNGKKETPKPAGAMVGGGEGSERTAKTGLLREEMERRTFVTLAYIIALYVICWVPFHIVYDVSLISPTLVPDSAFTYTFWMTYINSTVNPFLYAFTSRDVRATIWRIVTCRQFKRRR